MFSRNRKAGIVLGWWLAISAVCSLAVGLGFWGFVTTEHSVKSVAERQFILNVDFDAFRQLLVRTNATAAILEHGGMELVDETTETVDVDLSNDPRPLRNALRGKSKANVFAIKRLTVQLNDPQLKATELMLTQDCRIQPKMIHIVTTSDQPSGELRAYSTTLDAIRVGAGTEVTLKVELTVDVRIPRVFISQAESRVQDATELSTQSQEAAIRSLVTGLDRTIAITTNSPSQ